MSAFHVTSTDASIGAAATDTRNAVTDDGARCPDGGKSNADTRNAPECWLCEQPIGGTVVRLWRPAERRAGWSLRMHYAPRDCCETCVRERDLLRWYDLREDGMRTLGCAACDRVIKCDLQSYWLTSRRGRANWTVHAFCCEGCRRAVTNMERRQRRAGKRERSECAVCRQEFEPRRGDARYCSSPCRQKAYRGRQA